ncbi:hypothetical protein IWQ61_006603 [Dispira simplex]|nr:hypothetical protein IWQ61_006603 [Dispira simplex]
MFLFSGKYRTRKSSTSQSQSSPAERPTAGDISTQKYLTADHKLNMASFGADSRALYQPQGINDLLNEMSDLHLDGASPEEAQAETAGDLDMEDDQHLLDNPELLAELAQLAGEVVDPVDAADKPAPNPLSSPPLRQQKRKPTLSRTSSPLAHASEWNSGVDQTSRQSKDIFEGPQRQTFGLPNGPEDILSADSEEDEPEGSEGEAWKVTSTLQPTERPPLIEPSADVPSLQDTETVPTTSTSLPKGPPAESPTADSIITTATHPTVKTPPVTEITPAQLEERQLNFKKAALHFKSQGNLARAREMLVIAKGFTQLIRTATENGSLPPDTLLPDPPQLQTASQPELNPKPTPDPFTQTKKLSAKPASSTLGVLPVRDEVQDLAQIHEADSRTNDVPLPVPTPKEPPTHALDQLSSVQERLLEQQQLCTHISAYYYKRGKTDEAVRFHRYKKNIARDLETLRAHQESLAQSQSPNSPGQPVPLPLYHYQDVMYEVEEVHTDLSPRELELSIVRVGGLGHLKTLAGVTTKPDIYLKWDLNLTPQSSNTITLAKSSSETSGYLPGVLRSTALQWVGMGATTNPVDSPPVIVTDTKGSTPVAKRSLDPILNYRVRVPITRNRHLQRWAERKKLELTLFHYKGLMWGGSTWIGRVQIPLTTLIHRCELQGTFPILDKLRRPVTTDGRAFVEVKLRLNLPIHGQRMTTTREERWLFLDGIRYAAFGDDGLASTAVPERPSNTQAVEGVEPARTSTPPPGTTPMEISPKVNRTLIDQGNRESPPTAKSDVSPSLGQDEPTNATPTNPVSPTLETLLRPDTIVSNAVLEFELEVVQTLEQQVLPSFPTATTTSSPSTNSIDTWIEETTENLNKKYRDACRCWLTWQPRLVGIHRWSDSNALRLAIHERRQALETKVKLLETQVVVGQLLLSDYMDSVKQNAQQHKQWAVLLKRKDNMVAARWALSRSKLMTDEIQEVLDAAHQAE